MELSSNTPITYEVPTVSEGGRRLVVSDIHGCIRTFLRLLDRVELTKSDQLFLLGDYIDRGPNSKAVIDTLLDLKEEGYQLYMLRGNHEQMLLDYLSLPAEELEQYVKTCRTNNLFDKHMQMLEPYKTWMSSLPFYFDLGDYYLVHAGFNFEVPNPFEDTYHMLWIRWNTVPAEKLNGRKLIHGHTPMPLSAIEREIEKNAAKICLDNGCVYTMMDKGVGHLLCFNLDTSELTIQANIEDI
ncbi:metallophosphoesterase family protein [Limibacter armeniacum]|uniref:metallophosphoesterase family protein n=1 Tax=Limibacter armeniacum TaxID=466084 RepID=UPI002FE6B651